MQSLVVCQRASKVCSISRCQSEVFVSRINGMKSLNIIEVSRIFFQVSEELHKDHFLGLQELIAFSVH